ncbi:hypothetical protein [Agathobacter sp.]
MKKRLLILGMVLAIATATGCGESGNSSSDKSNNYKMVISEQNSEKDTSFDSEDGKKIQSINLLMI